MSSSTSPNKATRKVEDVKSPVPADIDIANSVEQLHISEIAQELNLGTHHYDLYGKYKAKHCSNEKKMEYEGGSAVRGWEDLHADILMRIFKCFEVFEWLTSGIPQVCSSWRSACCDPIIWKTVDLFFLNSTDHSLDKKLTRILKLSLNLSRGNTHALIFPLNMYVTNNHLTYAAKSYPNLRKLVIPQIKSSVLSQAIHIWKDLESFTMPSVEDPSCLVKEIAKNCRNFRELKMMGPFEIYIADTLAAFLPKLKVLTLRCSVLYKETLIYILDGLQSLEVLDISHCLLIEVPPPPASERILTTLDKTILEKAARLREFLTCMDQSCIMCQRTKNGEGLMRWYKYEEVMWRADNKKASNPCGRKL